MMEKERCVRCGRKLREKRKLRCEECMKLVMEELEWKADRPLHYYFKFNLKKRWKTDGNIME